MRVRRSIESAIEERRKHRCRLKSTPFPYKTREDKPHKLLNPFIRAATSQVAEEIGTVLDKDE